MDVVEKIRNVPTGTQRGMGDVPKAPVSIVKASRISAEEAAKK